uniref:Uncharacterized protein n=1 Tax=Rangifer tarandus platyrhynchus TaxID=3082113 RepID=A0ACB0ERG8_RANTA|nr:unnamed protein product [Rangifer tarandus platyrhynchus]
MLVVSLALPWAQVAASCFPEGTVVGTEPDSSARLARRRLAPKIPLERWEKRLCRLQAPLPPIPRPADDGDVLAGSSQAAAEPGAPGALSSVPTRRNRFAPGNGGAGGPRIGVSRRRVGGFGSSGPQCPGTSTRVWANLATENWAVVP